MRVEWKEDNCLSIERCDLSESGNLRIASQTWKGKIFSLSVFSSCVIFRGLEYEEEGGICSAFSPYTTLYIYSRSQKRCARRAAHDDTGRPKKTPCALLCAESWHMRWKGVTKGDKQKKAAFFWLVLNENFNHRSRRSSTNFRPSSSFIDSIRQIHAYKPPRVWYVK